MTVKSSKVKNFLSWWVSTVLKSFLLTSASCHLVLPYIIRPILHMPKSVPKIIYQSPEFDRSIFSRYFSVSKKSVHSFWHWASLIDLSSLFNINPCSFKNRYNPWWKSSWRTSRCCFSFGSACNRKCFVFVVEVSCSLSSYSLSIKSVTNLFNPWEILNCLWSQIQFLFPLHVYFAGRWLWLQIRVQFWCSLESNLSGQLICRLVETHTHDMSLVLQNFRTRQYVLSWKFVRLPLFSGIMHQYKLLSIDLVVKGFPSVLCASAIDVLVQES